MQKKTNTPVLGVAPAINKDLYSTDPYYEGIDRETRLLRLSERLVALVEDHIEVVTDGMGIDLDTPLTMVEQNCCYSIDYTAAYIANFIADINSIPAAVLTAAEKDTQDAFWAAFHERQWTSQLDAAAQAGLLVKLFE